MKSSTRPFHTTPGNPAAPVGYLGFARQALQRMRHENRSTADASRATDGSDEACLRDADWLGLHIFSRVLGEKVWLVRHDADAAQLEAQLAAEADRSLVFTLAELEAMRSMLAADMRTLVEVKRRLPGSRIDAVRSRQDA